MSIDRKRDNDNKWDYPLTTIFLLKKSWTLTCRTCDEWKRLPCGQLSLLFSLVSNSTHLICLCWTRIVSQIQQLAFQPRNPLVLKFSKQLIFQGQWKTLILCQSTSSGIYQSECTLVYCSADNLMRLAEVTNHLTPEYSCWIESM